MSTSLLLDKAIENNQWYGSAFYLMYLLHQNVSYNNKHITYACNKEIKTYYHQVIDIQVKKNQLKLTINMPGIIGSQSILPLKDQAILFVGPHHLKASITDFYNIFNHKLIQLSYQSWYQHRLILSYHETKAHTQNLHCVINQFLTNYAGLGQSKTKLDHYLISQGMYLRKHLMSIPMIESLFKNYFSIPLTIKTMVCEFKNLQKNQVNALASTNNQLANNMILGKKYMINQHKVTFNIGPIHYEDYKQLWPNQMLLKMVKEFIQKVMPAHIVVDINVKIINQQLPILKLERNNNLLGLNTFVYTDYNNKQLHTYQLTL